MMAVEETIAVVGLQSGKLSGFVERLVRDNFRILVIPGSKDQAERIMEEIRTLKPGGEVEVLDCAKDGCWEADIIAFINPHDFENKLIDRIREVAVQKVIVAVFEGVSIDIANERYAALKAALPHSKIVRLIVLSGEEKVSMWGDDSEAIQRVAVLLEKSPYTITQ